MKRVSIFVAAGIIILAVLLFVFSLQQDNSGKLDSFAVCLKDKGAMFYGTFWCLHCQNQKRAFGNSDRLLPYVECSAVDGKEQMQICKDKHIATYPTWTFTSSASVSAELSLKDLSDKTGCPLPN